MQQMRFFNAGTRVDAKATQGRATVGMAERRTRRAGFLKRCRLAIAMLGLAGWLGCSGESLETTYGRRYGPWGAASVNGTAVFAQMLVQRGHRVTSRTYLGRWLDRADCIVWFPNDFSPPREEVFNWLNEWLLVGEDRVLIYVGRDFDAAPLYFEKIIDRVDPKRRAEYVSAKRAAEQWYAIERQSFTAGANPWFTLDEAEANRPATELSGAPDWLEGIEMTGTEIRLGRRITPAAGSQIHLACGDEVILSEQQIGHSWLLIATNGSFLLNLPLVHPGHRTLAAKLIDRLGPQRRNVVFLESGVGGPPVLAQENTENQSTGLWLLVSHPFCWVLLSALVVASLFVMSKAIPFGPQRRLEDTPVADFGRHLEALGGLLAKTGDREFAIRQLVLYRQTVADSGRNVPRRP